MKGISSILFAACLVGGCVDTDSDVDPATRSDPTASPDVAPKSITPVKDTRGEVSLARRSSAISYHGGPVMTAGPNVYLIWYGNTSSGYQSLLTNLAKSLGGSPYFNINSTYYNGSNTHVANVVTYKGSTTDNYSQGTSLSDAQIQTVVSNAISSGRLPSDTNAVYFVMTSSDVNASSGFCTQYCGWHTNGTIGGKDIKYAFIGDPARCPSSCAEQTTTSPNGDVGADGAASIFSHELEEATTDPDLNAWYDRQGEENADKCAWTFGTESTASNGSKYNVTLGGTQYLIQQNWVETTQSCAMSH